MTDTPDSAMENDVAGSETSPADEEERRRFQRVLCGFLDDLPALSSKIVRIFTSSTFTGE